MKWFKKEREVLMATISKAKTTYNYKFAECETDEEKDAVIKQFMWHLFRFRLDS
jgi:protein-arginine kinase